MLASTPDASTAPAGRGLHLVPEHLDQAVGGAVGRAVASSAAVSAPSTMNAGPRCGDAAARARGLLEDVDPVRQVGRRLR
jgi:hypothetical protein